MLTPNEGDAFKLAPCHSDEVLDLELVRNVKNATSARGLQEVSFREQPS